MSDDWRRTHDWGALTLGQRRTGAEPSAITLNAAP